MGGGLCVRAVDEPRDANERCVRGGDDNPAVLITGECRPGGVLKWVMGPTPEPEWVDGAGDVECHVVAVVTDACQDSTR